MSSPLSSAGRNPYCIDKNYGKPSASLALLATYSPPSLLPSLLPPSLPPSLPGILAGVLIIWDRMFGTFEPERREEKVIYGLVHPLASWNPFWAQVKGWAWEQVKGWAWERVKGWEQVAQVKGVGAGSTGEGVGMGAGSTLDTCDCRWNNRIRH